MTSPTRYRGRAAVSWRVVLLLVMGLAACDVPDPLYPSNPYDPLGGPEGRTVTGPAGLEVLDTTPTSVTLAWEDRSTIEAGYEIRHVYGQRFGETVDSVMVALPPNTTTHTLDLRIITGDLKLVVVATAVDGGRSHPSNSIQLRYPRDEQDKFPDGDARGATYSRDASILFSGGTRVNVYDVSGPTGRFLYHTSTQWRNLYMVSETDAMLVTPVSGSQYAPIVVRRLTPDGVEPEVEIPALGCNDFMVSEEGRFASARCYGDTEWELRTWDTNTGEDVGRFSIGPRSHSVVLAFSPSAALALVRGVAGTTLELKRTTDGKVLWTEDGYSFDTIAQFAGAHLIVLDPRGSTGSPAVRVYDALTGNVLGEQEQVFTRDNRVEVREDRVLISSPRGWPRVARLPSLEPIRDVMIGQFESVQSRRLTPNGMVQINLDGVVKRWDFTRSWEVVPPDV